MFSQGLLEKGLFFLMKRIKLNYVNIKRETYFNCFLKRTISRVSIQAHLAFQTDDLSKYILIMELSIFIEFNEIVDHINIY